MKKVIDQLQATIYFGCPNTLMLSPGDLKGKQAIKPAGVNDFSER
jgi:hypothetical protein